MSQREAETRCGQYLTDTHTAQQALSTQAEQWRSRLTAMEVMQHMLMIVHTGD